MTFKVTRKRVEVLRRKKCSTEGKKVEYGDKDVEEMRRELEKHYDGVIRYSFAEKVLCRYLVYGET